MASATSRVAALRVAAAVPTHVRAGGRLWVHARATARVRVPGEAERAASAGGGFLAAAAAAVAMALGGWEAAPAMAGTSAVPGVYLDPSHPGCQRVIDAETGRVSGRDFLDANGLIGPPGTACTGHAPSELGAWSVAGQLVGPDAILIDFDAVDAVRILHAPMSPASPVRASPHAHEPPPTAPLRQTNTRRVRGRRLPPPPPPQRTLGARRVNGEEEKEPAMDSY